MPFLFNSCGESLRKNSHFKFKHSTKNCSIWGSFIRNKGHFNAEVQSRQKHKVLRFPISYSLWSPYYYMKQAALWWWRILIYVREILSMLLDAPYKYVYMYSIACMMPCMAVWVIAQWLDYFHRKIYAMTCKNVCATYSL